MGIAMDDGVAAADDGKVGGTIGWAASGEEGVAGSKAVDSSESVTRRLGMAEEA